MTFRAGDLVHLTRAASVQFATRSLIVRVVRELPQFHTYDGWLWLEGYELSPAGSAVAKREFFVMREGVRRLRTSDQPRRVPGAPRAPLGKTSAKV